MTREPASLPRVRWLAAIGLVLVVIVLLPPLEALARRYLFVESIQFSAFAIVAPALVVVGSPWGTGQRMVRLAQARQARQARLAPRRAVAFLMAWIAVAVSWRLPPVLDALQRHPLLTVLELATALPAGVGLWLELVPSRPFTPRAVRPLRAFMAALAMWSVWGVAYALGFATGAVVHGYDPAGSSLGTVSDQEIAVGLLWAVSGACFIPVIFAALLTWLRDGGGSDAESAADAAELTAPGGRGVRGWGRPAGR